jgi:hypothetical protein
MVEWGDEFAAGRFRWVFCFFFLAGEFVKEGERWCCRTVREIQFNFEISAFPDGFLFAGNVALPSL